MFSRNLSNRIARNIFSAMLVGSIVFAAGTASAAQLTLNWVDQAGGTAYFTIERKTGTAGTYATIATTGTGITTYADPTVVANTTYCYRVKASNVFGDSDYSNEDCGSVAAGFDFTVAKAGTGSGTVVSNPSGINCGSDCVASFAAGRVITLTATPSSGSTFSGWSGAGCSGPDPCTLVGNVPVTVTATFAAAGSDAVKSVAPNQATPGSVTLVVTGDPATEPYAVEAQTTLTEALTVNFFVDGSFFHQENVAKYCLFGGDASCGTGTLGAGARVIKAQVLAQGTSTVLAETQITVTEGSSPPPPGPVTLTLAYNGMLRDRVGQDNTALAPDGMLDGTLTATLSAAGGRTITGLRLDSNAPGTWDTDSATDYWVLGVAASLDGALLNAADTMAVNFAVADGGSFVVFASDYGAAPGGAFVSGTTLTLTATFADGSMATAVITLP